MGRYTTRVLSVDPGKTCGWSMGTGIVELDGGTIQHEEVFKLLTVNRSLGRVVIERFDPRRMDQDAVTTIETIGAIKHFARHFGIPVAFVNPDAKAKKLKEVEHIANRHHRDAEAIRLWDLVYGEWLT